MQLKNEFRIMLSDKHSKWRFHRAQFPCSQLQLRKANLRILHINFSQAKQHTEKNPAWLQR